MALNKITETDLEGKGVVGQAEVPGLPASEMQYKVEQIVREVAIPKINEVVDEFVNVDEKMTALGQSVGNSVANLTKDVEDFEKDVSQEVGDFRQQISGLSAEVENFPNTYATRENVEEIIENNGQAVTSVFGRVGAIAAQKGDYTPEMVGAAPEVHKHITGDITNFPTSMPASDVYSWAKAANKPSYNYSEVGAEQAGAVALHNESSSAHSGLFSAKQNKPTAVSASGAISVTLQDNCEYTYSGVTSLTMAATSGEAHGFVTFGSSAAVTLSGFSGIAGDDPRSGVANGQVWEFSCFKSRIIWKKWG